MFGNGEKWTLSPFEGLLFGQQKSDQCGIGWDGWEDFEPDPIREDLCDVFNLDDETAEPDPEPGDFWGEIDPEESNQ